MEENIKNKLEKKGWRIGSAQDFLELTDAEMEYIELKIALGRMLHEKRTETGYTQYKLAEKIIKLETNVEEMIFPFKAEDQITDQELSDDELAIIKEHLNNLE